VQRPTLDALLRLYHKYAGDLAAARRSQRELLFGAGRSMRAKLDDIEAEVTYLLLRERRPSTVVEIGTFDGWSTTWILTALRDNGCGELRSFDIRDGVLRHVPDELAGDRWRFTAGDVRGMGMVESIPPSTDYLFLDAAHSAAFARWYLAELFPRLGSGVAEISSDPVQPPPIPRGATPTPVYQRQPVVDLESGVPVDNREPVDESADGTLVSVHDVFHRRRPLPLSEGAVLLKWLADKGIDYFTPSARRAPLANARLRELRAELGLDEPIRAGRANPMVFFELP